MENLKTKRIVAGVIAIVMVAILLNTYKVYNKNETLKSSLNSEKLVSEKLLSEKLLLKKEIDEFREEIKSLQGKNSEADRLLERANRSINDKEVQIKTLAKEAKDAKYLRGQLADIRKIRQNLLEEFNKITDYNSKLKSENDELQVTINGLLADNKSLSDKLKEKSFVGSNFKIEVLKGKKDRLTVKAKRTEKLRIEFEVAQSTYPVNSKLIHIDLLSPEGALKSGEITTSVENGSELSASIDNVSLYLAPQKVTIDYSPKEPLKKGIYTAIVFHNNTFLGKAQFRLMK